MPGQDNGWEGLFMVIYLLPGGSPFHGNCASPSRKYSSNIDLYV